MTSQCQPNRTGNPPVADPPYSLLRGAGPIQVPVKKFERSFAVNGMGAGEPFDLASLVYAQLGLI